MQKQQFARHTVCGAHKRCVLHASVFRAAPSGISHGLQRPKEKGPQCKMQTLPRCAFHRMPSTLNTLNTSQNTSLNNCSNGQLIPPCDGLSQRTQARPVLSNVNHLPARRGDPLGSEERTCFPFSAVSLSLSLLRLGGRCVESNRILAAIANQLVASAALPLPSSFACGLQ